MSMKVDRNLLNAPSQNESSSFWHYVNTHSRSRIRSHSRSRSHSHSHSRSHGYRIGP
jgi:hypothetical protein